MQQQLAAICCNSSSNPFLAPASWRACQCLTHLAVDLTAADLPHALILDAALQTISLVDLTLTVDFMFSAASCLAFQQLSQLTNLTQLNLHQELAGYEDADGAAAMEQLLAAAARVSSLCQLTVSSSNSRSNSGGSADGNTPFCMDLSALPHLTSLELGVWGLVVDLSTLARAPALRQLSMSDCTVVGSLVSLFPLTSLTRLEGAFAMAAQAYAPGSAAGLSEAPAAWRQDLRSLSWLDHDDDDGSTLWRLVVPRLTSLTQLCMTDICVSSDFCR